VLGFNAWSVGNVLQDTTSQMDKDEDLQEMIQSTFSTYARRLKMAWDVKNWDRKSTKASRTQKLTDVLNFHESKMIHGS
jgi:DNA-binding transcriptional regulator GbsR (MarR family)